jgi:hypothetical protein
MNIHISLKRPHIGNAVAFAVICEILILTLMGAWFVVFIFLMVLWRIILANEVD